MVDAKKKPDDEPSATQTLTAAQLRASGAEGGGRGSGEDVVVPVDQPPPVALGPEGAGSGSGEARPPPSATPTASDVTPSQDWEAAKRLALDVAPKFNHAVEKVAKTVAGVAIGNPDLLPGGMLNDPAPPSAAAPKPAVVPVDYEEKPASGGAETVSKPTFATIPAHSVPLVAPGIRQEIEAGEGAQFAGAEQQTEVEAQRADELARAKAQAEEDMRVLQLQHAQDRDRQRSALEDHLGQIQAKADAVAAKKVDPTQYMEQLGLGGQFLGALAVGLGAFGQAFGGGPNVAFEMLNKQIDRNIESQAKNIELGHQALEADKGVYAEKMRIFGDDEKARAAAKQEALAAAAQQIDVIVARNDSPDIRARGEQIKGQLAREFGFEQAKLEQYKPTQTVQTGGGQSMGLSEKDLALVFKDPKTGIAYKARDEDSRKKLIAAHETDSELQKLATAYGQQVAKLTTADKLSADIRAPTEAMAEAQSTYNTLLAVERRAQHDGIWKKSEQELFKTTLPPPQKLFGAHASVVAKQISGYSTRGLQQAMAAEDPLPITQSWTHNAKGQLEPTAGYTGETYKPPAQPPTAHPPDMRQPGK